MGPCIGPQERLGEVIFALRCLGRAVHVSEAVRQAQRGELRRWSDPSVGQNVAVNGGQMPPQNIFLMVTGLYLPASQMRLCVL